MVGLRREVWYFTDYILDMDLNLFRSMSVRYLRPNSYQYMILGCLISVALREYTYYFGRFTWIPFVPRHPDTLRSSSQGSFIGDTKY